MLIKIKPNNGHLHFESGGDILSALIDNFEELFVSNNSITFHYGDIDGSIHAIPNGVSCVFKQGSFAPWFACDEVHIMINPERVDIHGLRDGNYVVQLICVNG